ncbi:MAG: tetratricopeptide repeat protein, partial [Pseudomonadota bacterium]
PRATGRCEEGPWLLLPLLPLAALLFRRGVLVCLVLMVAPWPSAHAADADSLWASLWKRPDQRGVELFDAEQPERAAATFDDREWRAAAHFRAGAFERSAAELTGVDTPRGHYNRGNALAGAQDIGGAIAAYERALELDPDHEDARYNLEQLLQQQEQQQQQQSGEGESEGDPNESDEAGGDPSQGGDSGEGGEQDGQQGESSDGDGEQQAGADGAQGGGEQDEDPEALQAEAGDGAEEDSDGDGEDGEALSAAAADELQDEESQSAELWLRRIPDDPGGLLRRKLLYQHRQRDRRGETEDETW